MADNNNKSGEATVVSPDLQKSLEIIADVLLEKSKGTNLSGGKPFDSSTAAPAEKLTAKEQARQYFKGHKDFPWPGIHITSDGQIFLGNPAGENARDNHVAANKGMTFDSFKKPE